MPFALGSATSSMRLGSRVALLARRASGQRFFVFVRPRAQEHFVKSKKVAAVGGKVAQVLARWTEGMLRDSA